MPLRSAGIVYAVMRLVLLVLAASLLVPATAGAKTCAEPGEEWSWCFEDEVALVLPNVRGETRIPPSPLG